MLKWVIELSEYKIKYQPRLVLKGQVMADFIAELPQKSSHLADSLREGWWTLHVDGTSRASGARRYALIPHMPSEVLNLVTSPWSFALWEMDIVGPLPVAAA
ncbi:hypothetical protein CK203_099135 [Vitis vinifera]|uniref:Uncharacterized protein n=1 Tax=Vitis vinifera TaxID=29760 RepID=A0A438CWQ5_VITVI|nr:hypothetical protein CK203_099135 [Vitis vinifera]